MTSSERNQSPPSRVIGADRSAGLRRWTIGGFDAAVESTAPAEPVRVADVRLPTADDVEAIERQAREEGYRAGLALGQETSARIAGLLDGVAESVGRMEREMAQSLIKLAVDLARQVVRETIAVRPELIVPVIDEALSGLARTAEPGALHVHPADLPIVAERLGDVLAHAGWTAFGDDRMTRGGCRLEFAGGQVDATIPTRWTRVMAQLERTDAWLD